MYYTGIDLHKFTSYLTTVDPSGAIVKRENLNILALFQVNTKQLSNLP
jgi:hypothetical protein